MSNIKGLYKMIGVRRCKIWLKKREEIKYTMIKPDKAETKDIEYWKRDK